MRYVMFLGCVLALSGLDVLATAVSRDSGLPATAHAQAGNSRTDKRMQRGQAAFEAQDYEKAVRLLRRVADDDRAERAQRTRALELIGLSRFILGDRDAARETFLELVVLEPGYELRDDFGSEEIRRAFELVKAEFLENNAPVKLALSRVARKRAGRPVTIEVKVEYGADQVKEAVVLARRHGQADFQPTAMAPLGDGRWRARVPTSAGSGYALEYYIESRDLGGRANARIGGPLNPRTLDIDAARKPPWYRRWYTIAGGVALLGVTTAVLIGASR